MKQKRRLLAVANDGRKELLAQILEKEWDIINERYDEILGTDGTIDSVVEKFFAHKLLTRIGHAARGDIAAAYLLQQLKDDISLDCLVLLDAQVEGHEPYKRVLALSLFDASATWLPNYTTAITFFDALRGDM